MDCAAPLAVSTSIHPAVVSIGAAAVGLLYCSGVWLLLAATGCYGTGCLHLSSPPTDLLPPYIQPPVSWCSSFPLSLVRSHHSSLCIECTAQSITGTRTISSTFLDRCKGRCDVVDIPSAVASSRFTSSKQEAAIATLTSASVTPVPSHPMRSIFSRKPSAQPSAAPVVPIPAGISHDASSTLHSSSDNSPTLLPYKPTSSVPPPNISATISSLGLSTVSPTTLAASGIHVLQPPPIASPTPPTFTPSSSSPPSASPSLAPQMLEITPAFHPHSSAFTLATPSPDRLSFVADAIAFSQSRLPLPAASNCSFSPSLASRPHSRSVDLTALPLDTMTKQLQAKQVMLNELEASHAEQLELIGRLKTERRAWEAEEARRRKEIDEMKELNDMLMNQCSEQAKQLSLLSKKTGGKSMFLMRDAVAGAAAAGTGSAPPSPLFDKTHSASAHGSAVNGVHAASSSTVGASFSSALDLALHNSAASSSAATASSLSSQSMSSSSSHSVPSTAGLSLAVASSSTRLSSSPSASTAAMSPTSPSFLSTTLNMTVTSLEQQLATAHETIQKQKKELSLLRFLHPHTHQNEAKLSSISSLYAEEKEENEKLRKKLDELNTLNEDLEMALERQDGVIESLSVQQEESGRKERGWRAECEEWKAREGKVREELKCCGGRQGGGRDAANDGGAREGRGER